MLGHVFYEGVEALWEDILKDERALRRDRGWAIVEYEMSNLTEADLENAFDSALTEAKKFVLLLYRAMGFQKTGESWMPLGRAGAPPEVSQESMDIGKVRVRRVGQRSKQ